MITENYITKIIVNHSRNVDKIEIPLFEKQRQHLILTGKNGSGKTSLLLEINKYLSAIENGNFENLDRSKEMYENSKIRISDANLSDRDKHIVLHDIQSYESWYNQTFGATDIEFSGVKKQIISKSQNGSFILAFFDSKRHTNLNVPLGINKVELKQKYTLNEKANVNFIQYIVNLKADRSFARDDNEFDTVKKIDAWFERLENRLTSIFNVNSLILKFDRKTYNFDIVLDEDEPINFNTLSDGYSAIISIVTELLLRMEAHNVKTYDLEGIVIIDEIETHLHVDLQKKILPFLTDFFPKIQFIVSTHSPFVLSSLSNATICDLETKTVINDLSGYSYDALIESYFKTDKYSEIIKSKIIEFEHLISIEKRTFEQNENLRFLRKYFAHTPKYLSSELMVKLQQIKLKELNNKQ